MSSKAAKERYERETGKCPYRYVSIDGHSKFGETQDYIEWLEGIASEDIASEVERDATWLEYTVHTKHGILLIFATSPEHAKEIARSDGHEVIE